MEIHYCAQNALNIKIVVYLLLKTTPSRGECCQSSVLSVNKNKQLKLQKTDEMLGVSGNNQTNGQKLLTSCYFHSISVVNSQINRQKCRATPPQSALWGYTVSCDALCVVLKF